MLQNEHDNKVVREKEDIGLKKLLKILVSVILIAVLLFGGYLGILTVTDLNHEPIEALTVKNNQEALLDSTGTYQVTTFNIGYAGLDAAQDFFLDGGKKGRSSSKEQTEKNLEATIQFLEENNDDFVYLQEVDTKALRSFKIDQYQSIIDKLPEYGSVFANNYHAQWVPVPILEPIGYVDAGMPIFSKYKIETANRHQLNGQESWPMKLMELDRCFVDSEVKLENGKSLFLVNLHLSAYDEGGTLRNKQVKHLISYMTEKYEAGHYVILGGDWNQLLSDVQESDPEFVKNWPAWLVKVPTSLTETGFEFAVDETKMTVRDLAAAYVEGETFVTIIDGFLVSPNVEVVEVNTHDLNFANSDHNPVTLTFKLKN